MDELRTSSESLSNALESYLASFSSFTSRFDPETKSTLHGFSRATITTVLSELEVISTHEKKLKQVKIIALQARNSLPPLVPINALPSDLLAYIFKLVLETQPCLNGGPEDKAPSLLGYREIPSHVCVRWRCVAIESCALWSHIDIAPQFKEATSSCANPDKWLCSRILLARARVFAVLARGALLDVHFGKRRILKEGADADLMAFCSLIAPRVRYLDFAPGYFGDPACAILMTFLAACSPGILRQLAIRCGGYSNAYNPPFVDTIAASVNPTNQQPPFPGDFVGKLLFPVNVLRLKRLYLTWTSQAYHGLTELRLTDRIGTVTQLQLSAILAASPGLCILHFSLIVTDAISRPTPITLPALKTLNLGSIDHRSCQALLPLIAPGSEPLHFVFGILPPPGEVWGTRSLFTNELNFFFDRSNVAALYLKIYQGNEDPHYQTLPQLLELLSLPELRMLCLEGFDFIYKGLCLLGHPENTPSRFGELSINSDTEFACSKLHALSFIHCRLGWTGIREVVKALPIQEMKLAHSQIMAVVMNDTGSRYEFDFYTPERAQREVKNIAAFPQIEVRPALPEVLRDKWDSWPREEHFLSE